MAITIQSSRENEDDKTVFFTIEYDGKDYKWHGDIPKDADAEDFLDAKSDILKTEILRKQYNKAVVPQLEGKSALESFEAWISDGAKNAGVKGTDIEGNKYVIKPEETISKKTWVDSH
tara:strand:+ start:498 stop:851 length:354 start_codon:yes stop_codon:yes gene_type:complete